MVTCRIAVAVGLLVTSVPAQRFFPGDAFLVTNANPNQSQGGAAVLRISSTPRTLLTMRVLHSEAIYDSYRDRIVFCATSGGTTPAVAVWAMSATGALTKLPIPVAPVTPKSLAATSRGDIYVIYNTKLLVLDKANAVHVVKDATNTKGFAVPQAAGRQSLFYDRGENALLYCYPEAKSNNQLALTRIPLSTSGRHVAGALKTVRFAVDPANTGQPRGFSRGPREKLFLPVDGGAGRRPRLRLVDPRTMHVGVYASTGAYFGDGAVHAGCYVPQKDWGIMLDTLNNNIRAYKENSQNPGGQIIASGVSPGGSHSEFASLIVVARPDSNYGLSRDKGRLSVATGGLQKLTGKFGASRGGHLYLVVGSSTSWLPGITVSGRTLPIRPDAYTAFALAVGSTGPFSSFAGRTNAKGEMAAAFVLPPNAPKSLVGLSLYHAALAFDPVLAPSFATNAVPVTFVR